MSQVIDYIGEALMVAGMVAITLFTAGTAAPLLIGVLGIMGAAGAATLVISGVVSAIKGSGSSSGLLNNKQAQLITERQAAAPRRVIYGSTRVGGIYTFMAVDSGGQDLYLVITLSGCQLQSIGTMYFDGTAVPLNGSGDCVTGTWANLVHVEKNLGTTGQTAFSGLVAANVGWKSTSTQSACACVYVRLQYGKTATDPSNPWNGMPNITFDVTGVPCYDPRTPATPATYNPALCIADYLCNPIYGLGADYATRMDEADLIAAANICDESITLNGRVQTATIINGGVGYAAGNTSSINAGNHDSVVWIAQTTAAGAVQRIILQAGGSAYTTANNVGTTVITGSGNGGLTVDITTEYGTEPRYTMNGMFDTAQTPNGILGQMCASMGGSMVFSGGLWHIYPGVWRSATLSISESDIIGPIHYQSLQSARDISNGVKGTYGGGAAYNYQETDFPAVSSGAYITEDNGVQTWTDLQLPFTTSPSTSQRLATILLEDQRHQGILDIKCKLTCYSAVPYDVIEVTNAHFGWTNKCFQVLSTSLDIAEDGSLCYNIHSKETDSGIYSWTLAQDLEPTAVATTQMPTVIQEPNPTTLLLNPNFENGDVWWDKGTGWTIVNDSTEAYT